MSFSLERADELMRQSHDAGRLAHAYLLTGPDGAGKQELAVRIIRMANRLPESPGLTLDELRSGSVAVVRPESKSRRITVGSIREAEATLYKTAGRGVTKFAVIVDCDRMGPAAENAFLKTLEEPPHASMLLLLTAHPEQLLDTILSRCIRVPLRGPSGPVELNAGARRFLDAIRAHAESGAGGMSAALGLMAQFTAVLKEEKAGIAERNEEAFKAEVAQYKQTTEGDWLKRREESIKALTEAEYLQTRSRLLEYLLAWFGDILRRQQGVHHPDLAEYTGATAALAERLTPAELNRKIAAIEALRSHFNTNVNETLALESAFIRAFA